MLWLVLGLLVFLGVHSASIVAPAWRDAMAARLGEPAWKGLYSVASAIGFALIVVGYGAARAHPVLVYTPPTFLRHVALLLLVPVFPLLLAAYLPGRIKAAARHPMLLATKIWAAAHLLANGSFADLLLFGGFLAWAVADRISLKRRAPRPVPGAPASPINDAVVIVVGLALYGLFVVWAHAWLTGVAPLG
jgi:uncharacterized membrane protein